MAENEYIEKSRVYKAMVEFINPNTEVLQKALRQVIDEISPADVEPVRHGRWVYNSPEDSIPYCSECLMPQDSECNFCPSCGAKMDGRNNNG